MSFTVPNAIKFGATIASLEQAEPDSLDFTLLGDRRNVVLSGGNVTATSSAVSAYIAVTLAACEAVINATYVSIASSVVTIASAPTSGSRFDLICARLDGTASFVVVTGTVSTSNPVYPDVPLNHVPLHAVFVRSGLQTGVTNQLVVDKRVLSGPSVYRRGINDPTGGVAGDLYLKQGGPSGGRSSLWLNNGSSWENLGAFTAVSSSNTADTLVLRNSSGNFSAGMITANLTGNVTGTASNVPWTGVTGRPEVGNVFVRNVAPLVGDGVNGDVWIQVTL
jgi:hypothetical protein